MNREEAIKAFNEGKQISHERFNQGEFICKNLETGIISDEKNEPVDPEIWDFFKGNKWETGWREVI